MITIEQIEVAIDAIKAENRLLRRLVEQRQKRSKQRKLDDEYKYERLACRVPEIEKVLVGTEDEARELFETYNL